MKKVHFNRFLTIVLDKSTFDKQQWCHKAFSNNSFDHIGAQYQEINILQHEFSLILNTLCSAKSCT